ncbi:DUF2986 domain-containing protein [Aquipseudomonas alcaligenes]|uniref:DUF2986 domain-containing protein n=1 Tax=Aquipseudomonas alcaligenes TaxID=43263 RepID=UPI0037497E8B
MLVSALRQACSAGPEPADLLLFARLQIGWKSMNRRKKINQLLKAHAKKASAKLAPKSNKPKYISKADRLKLAAEQDQATPAED